MNIDLDKLERAALDAMDAGAWPFTLKAYQNLTTPATMLQLVRRLRAAEARAYPETLTPPLAHVLGFLNFRTGPMAHLFRAAGHDIRTKCEDEQAFVLDRMVRTVIEHGENWADVFAEDLRKAEDIRKSKAAQGASHD